jgi:hypothetical protein
MHPCRIAQVRERPEHELVDHVEHRRVGADPETEREDDGRGEPRLTAEAPERVANVLLAMVEPGNRPPFAGLLAYASHVADAAFRGMGGVVRTSVSCPLVAREPFGVKSELIGQLGIEPVSAEPIVEAGKQFAHGAARGGVSSVGG